MTEESAGTDDGDLGVPLWKRVVAVVGGLLALMIVALTAAAVALFYPILRDDFQLDQAVLAVGLDWRDFGVERGRERLALEFADRGIQQPRLQDCTFTEGESRVVRCTWGVRIELPGEATLPLDFESVAHVGADGDLR